MIEHHDMNSNNSYILSFQCPDKVGVVAATTALFYDHGAFITEVANYSDPVSETFHMRCVFDDHQMTLSFDEFSEKFQIIAKDFRMTLRLRSVTKLPRVIIAVSKYDHCLSVLLNKWKSGALPPTSSA